jgi:hypothetical protein
MHRGVQVQRLGEHREVVGIGVHVVAVPWPAGAAVATPIVRDTSVSVPGEKLHLVFTGVRRQRPSVTENDGLSGRPVFVIDLRAVLGPYDNDDSRVKITRCLPQRTTRSRRARHRRSYGSELLLGRPAFKRGDRVSMTVHQLTCARKDSDWVRGPSRLV